MFSSSDEMKSKLFDADILMSKQQESLAKSSRLGDHEEVARLLASGVDAMFFNSCCLQYAAEHGHVKCVELLLPVSDVVAADGAAMRKALTGDYPECVGLLVKPVSSALGGVVEFVRMAASSGKAECLAKLLPYAVDPFAQALRLAARNGHLACVRQFVEKEDNGYSSEDYVSGVVASVLGMRRDVVRYLLPYADVGRVWDSLDIFQDADGEALLKSVQEELALSERCGSVGSRPSSKGL